MDDEDEDQAMSDMIASPVETSKALEAWVHNAVGDYIRLRTPMNFCCTAIDALWRDHWACLEMGRCRYARQILERRSRHWLCIRI